jgi:hypothetical protein
MQLTREKHIQYMVKLAPYLLVAVIIQGYLYFHFFPRNLAHDITVFLSIGVAFILAGFCAYDHFHQVILRENYLEIAVRPLKYQEEILYRNIQAYEIIPTRHGFSSVKLFLKDGHAVKIYYLDDAEKFIHIIKKKQSKVSQYPNL